MKQYESIAIRATNGNASVGPIRNLLLCLIVLLSAFPLSGYAQSVDAPENIRIEQNLLVWDNVVAATKYDVYLLSSTGLNANGTYLTTVVGANEYALSNEGIYTVVSVTTDGEYSTLESGGRAVFNSESSEPTPSTGNLISEIRTQRCDNAVAGSSCVAQCPLSSNYSATGGACRADTGTVIHQRARRTGFECIVQNDTSFVEADVYCRRP